MYATLILPSFAVANGVAVKLASFLPLTLVHLSFGGENSNPDADGDIDTPCIGSTEMERVSVTEVPAMDIEGK